MLIHKIKDTISSISLLSPQTIGLSSAPWMKKIYTACNNYRDAINIEEWEKRFVEDISRIQNIISKANSLKLALENAPRLPWWYDNGFSNVRMNISKGIDEAIELCAVANPDMRIPIQAEHGFRSKLNTDSAAN
ncbi:hypothetical protein [Desulfomicrobium salsuginis]